jgi:hypothetical protein
VSATGFGRLLKEAGTHGATERRVHGALVAEITQERKPT